MNNNSKKKIIVIVGTTASGKTTLAVDLAYRFNGEVVSADSRQVYKHMNIGTGKDLAEYTITKGAKKIKIPHHLIDVVNPNTEYNLAKFLKAAHKAIDDIHSRDKTPIIAGGTGLFTQAIVDGYNLNDSKDNKKLRKKLESLSLKMLQFRLKQLDPICLKSLNNSDLNNKRRLIRHIEKIKNSNSSQNKKSTPKYDSLILGVTWPKETLAKRIDKRLNKRFQKEGMTQEVETLHKKHRVSWKRLESFGLEYKFISQYLQKKISFEEMQKQLSRAIKKFAKMQKSWLKRWEKQGTKIIWVSDLKKLQINKLVRAFLK